MADKPVEASGAPPKSKKLLVVVVAAILVLALAGAGAFFYFSKQRAAALEDGEESVVTVEAKGPPTYLPLDNMVVNLADPGGEKVVQIGITLQLADAHATESVKQFLPTIRSGVLMLVSQRTSEELLQREGKEKLAADILVEASRPFGGGAAELGGEAPKESAKAKKAKAPKPAKRLAEMPVQRVLFSSFIVQ